MYVAPFRLFVDTNGSYRPATSFFRVQAFHFRNIASDYIASDYIASGYVASDYIASDYIASDNIASDYNASDYIASDYIASFPTKLSARYSAPQMSSHVGLCIKQWGMLQRTVSFINKIRMIQRTQMLQRTRRNTIGRQ